MIMCLAQGHNAVLPVRLNQQPFDLESKHSTTESLHSLFINLKISTCSEFAHLSSSILYILKK